MSYLNKWTCLLLMILAMGGCSNSNEETIIEQPDATLSVSASSFSFTADGGTESFTISSNTTWRINFQSTDWCTPSLQSTKGDATVTLTAAENSSTEERNLTLTLTAEGAETINLQCTQAAGEAEPTEPEKPAYIDPDNTDMSSLSAVDFAAQMGLGWNLGNTMEAILINGDNLSGNESSWGNPLVTKTFIDAVKAAGFNTIRIPVSWSHQLVDETTFQISWEWKQRVEEVINYALDNDMFVMINIHWDGGWMDHPDNAHKDAINTKLEAFWKQIAIYFRDYNDHLLFAGTNEVHVEGDYGTPSAENLEVQSSFNQTFVDAVRATGGRNAYRFLVVQAYNTNIDLAVEHLSMPTDDATDRLMAEVHYYDPYDFTLQEDGEFKTQWGTGYTDVSNWGQEAWVDETFGKMKTNFIDQGIPVILGEYGAILRSSLTSGLDEHIAARNYYLNYVTKAAVQNGMIPCYWDNGPTGNNSMGLFNRSTGEVVHADALNAIVSAASNE